MSGLGLPDHMTHLLGWTLIHFLWQGALVAALLAVANALIESRRVELRYAFACSSMALLVAMPIVTAWSISLSPDMDPRFSEPVLISDGRIDNGPVAPIASLVLDVDGPHADWTVSAAAIEAHLPWMVHVWMAGVAVLLLRVAGGWLQLRSLRRNSEPIPEPRWRGAVQVLAQRLGIRARILLLESTRIAVPIVVGWLRPAILVPIGLFAGMSPQHIEAVLVHELAHIRRWDSLVNLLQALAESLLFFHPAVWWVSGRIRIEREFCCDNAVVSMLGDATAYARALSIVGERRGQQLAVAANSGGLLPRIQRLLRTEPAGFPVDWIAPLAASSMALVLLTVTLPFLKVQVEEAVLAVVSRLRVEQPQLPQIESLGLELRLASPLEFASRVTPEALPSPAVDDARTEEIVDFSATAIAELATFRPAIPDRAGSVADPPRVAVYSPSDPRYWIGEYEGTADIHVYRVRPTTTDSTGVKDQYWNDRRFIVRIKPLDKIHSSHDLLAPYADIEVEFHNPYQPGRHPAGYGSFIVDLDLNAVIYGNFRDRWGRHSVTGRMHKEGDRLVGTFTSFNGYTYRDNSRLDSPGVPDAKFSFEVRKRFLTER